MPGTVDGLNDGAILSAADGFTDEEALGAVNGVELGVKDNVADGNTIGIGLGAIDGNAFANGDGDESVLGLILGTWSSGWCRAGRRRWCN